MSTLGTCVSKCSYRPSQRQAHGLREAEGRQDWERGGHIQDDEPIPPTPPDLEPCLMDIDPLGLDPLPNPVGDPRP